MPSGIPMSGSVLHEVTFNKWDVLRGEERREVTG